MSTRRLALTIPTVLVVLAGALLFSSAPAMALLGHEYLSQLTGFQNPVAMTTDSSSNLYVVDAGSKTVDRFNAADAPSPFSASEPYLEGSKIIGTPTGAGGAVVPFENPQGVAVDNATGKIFISDYEQKVVDEFSADGQFISQLTGPLSSPFAHPRALAVDQATNELVVTDGENHVADIVNSSDKYISQVSGEYLLQLTKSIAINESSKYLYVGGNQITILGNLGESSLSTWEATNTPGSPISSGTGKPFFGGSENLGVDQTTGHVYITNTDQGSPVVDEYTSSLEEEYEGQLTGPPGGGFTFPTAITVDPNNSDVFVADASGVVDIFGPDIPVSPVVTEASYSAVDSGSASLSARIETGSAPSTYHFEYGTTAAYGSSTESSTTSGRPVVSARVEGLVPNTEYHFRLVAESIGGTTYGSDVSFRTLPSGIQGLPDGRVYEMVTPPNKEDAEVYIPEAENPENQAEGYLTPHLAEAAANGDAVVYAGDPTHDGEGESSGNGNGSDYLAKRLPDGGWTQISIQPPGRRLTEYRGFSADLSVGVLTSPTENPEQSELQLPGDNTPGGVQIGEEYKALIDIYSHDLLEESYQPLFTAAPKRSPLEFGGVVPDTGTGEDGHSPIYAGASADMSRLLFEANDDLLEGEGLLQKELREDVKQEMSYYQAELDYLYDWHQGQLSLIDVLPDGRVAQNATFGSSHFPGEEDRGNPPDFSHVISSDGSRIFWSTLEGSGYSPKPTALYVRENGEQPQSPLNENGECTVPADACTIQIDKGIEGEGGARFWTASSDGSKAFFTKGALYEYEVNPVGGRLGMLTDLTPGVEVQGVLGASEDGDSIYYVSGSGELNFLHEEDNKWDIPVSIATLSGQDGYGVSPFNGLLLFALNYEGTAGDWVPDIGQRTAEVTPNGQGLVFMSSQSLKVPGYPAGYPSDGRDEVYVYDASQKKLFCASCSQSGEEGASGFIPVSWSDSYIPTLISKSGERVFFDSPTSLVSRDTNGKMDVYEWEREGSGSCKQGDGADGGCIYLLSGGTSNESSWLLGASTSGSDVFMITRADLTADAQDELYKVFDARVEGSNPVTPPACTGTGCQGVPAPAPIFATPSSVTYNGVGNFSPIGGVVLKVKAKERSLTRRQKLMKALVVCRGKPRKRRAICVANAKKRYGVGSKTRKPASAKGGK